LLKSPPEVSLTPPVSLASVSFNHTAGPGGKPLQISVMSAQNHKTLSFLCRITCLNTSREESCRCITKTLPAAAIYQGSIGSGHKAENFLFSSVWLQSRQQKAEALLLLLKVKRLRQTTVRLNTLLPYMSKASNWKYADSTSCHLVALGMRARDCFCVSLKSRLLDTA